VLYGQRLSRQRLETELSAQGDHGGETVSKTELRLRFEVLTAMAMKNIILWDVTPCSLAEGYWRFGGTHCNLLQDRNVSYESK
jgi:hypothetical protein